MAILFSDNVALFDAAQTTARRQGSKLPRDGEFFEA